MLTKKFQAVIHKLTRDFKQCPYPWALTGSAGMVLQGMQMAVHDIDIQTTREGAVWISGQMKDNQVQPLHHWETTVMLSWYSRFKVEGISVEVIGDIQKRDQNGKFGIPPDLLKVIKYVDNGTIRIPVLDLTYEEMAYRRIGKIDKARQIAAFISSDTWKDGFIGEIYL
jgi:hypothetical protein